MSETPTRIEDYRVLYADIPAFECKPDCNECCGPMPGFTAVEWEAVPEKRTCDAYTCPYKGETRCELYEHRPFICRLFGNIEGFTCNYGHGPEKLLTREQGKKLKKRYYELEAKEQHG